MSKDNNYYTVTEIEAFMRDHLQSKIDHDELSLLCINIEDPDIFKQQMELFTHGLFEGIINGIMMAGGTVEGIK